MPLRRGQQQQFGVYHNTKDPPHLALQPVLNELLHTKKEQIETTIHMGSTETNEHYFIVGFKDMVEWLDVFYESKMNPPFDMQTSHSLQSDEWY